MKSIFCATTSLAFVFAGVETNAMNFCSEPSQPTCTSSFYDFSDEYSFNRCKNDVEAYLSEIENYRSCLAAEIDDAAEEANSVIEEFNCKAEGRSFCP